MQLFIFLDSYANLDHTITKGLNWIFEQDSFVDNYLDIFR